MQTVKVISSNKDEALLERMDCAAPGQQVISRDRKQFSAKEFKQKYPVGKQFEIDLTDVPIRVYAVETSEPYYQRFETGLADGLILYFDRGVAQEVADYMHETFPDDDEPAWVAELDVV
jgi:hypothetical protein